MHSLSVVICSIVGNLIKAVCSIIPKQLYTRSKDCDMPVVSPSISYSHNTLIGWSAVCVCVCVSDGKRMGRDLMLNASMLLKVLSVLPSESIESVEITAQPGFQVELGQHLNLTCTVVATGLDEIMWTWSGLNNTDIEVVTDISAGVSNLTIRAVSASDLGHYSCEVVAGSVVRNTSEIITTESK